MSKINNDGLDQYGAEPFEQQQFGTAGTEAVNYKSSCLQDVMCIGRIPFYYEMKILFMLWLLSPATKGSSIIYRKLVHPQLNRREVVRGRRTSSTLRVNDRNHNN